MLLGGNGSVVKRAPPNWKIDCSMVTEGIAVALLGQERSPQSPRQGLSSGFGLPLTTVTKNQRKKIIMLFFLLLAD